MACMRKNDGDDDDVDPAEKKKNIKDNPFSVFLHSPLRRRLSISTPFFAPHPQSTSPKPPQNLLMLKIK